MSLARYLSRQVGVYFNVGHCDSERAVALQGGVSLCSWTHRPFCSGRQSFSVLVSWNLVGASCSSLFLELFSVFPHRSGAPQRLPGVRLLSCPLEPRKPYASLRSLSQWWYFSLSRFWVFFFSDELGPSNAFHGVPPSLSQRGCPVLTRQMGSCPRRRRPRIRGSVPVTGRACHTRAGGVWCEQGHRPHHPWKHRLPGLSRLLGDNGVFCHGARRPGRRVGRSGPSGPWGPWVLWEVTVREHFCSGPRLPGSGVGGGSGGGAPPGPPR